MRRAALAASVLCASVVHGAQAQEPCRRMPPPVESLDDVRDNFLILRSNRLTYVLNDDCFTIDRAGFGGILRFSFLNRFPEDLPVRVGYVLVRSYRLFTNEQFTKLKISRGDGWYFPGADGTEPTQLDRLDDEPFEGTLGEWDAAYGGAATPAEISGKLKVQWHAYADKGLRFPSNRPPAFWKVPAGFDAVNGGLTNYLLRFDVNTGNAESLIPFVVYAQKEVERVELMITSNIEALSGVYTLHLR